MSIKIQQTTSSQPLGTFHSRYLRLMKLSRSGTFYQIRDIYKLRNRLATSHNYLSMDTERQLLDVLVETTTHSQVNREVVSFSLNVGERAWQHDFHTLFVA